MYALIPRNPFRSLIAKSLRLDPTGIPLAYACRGYAKDL